MNRVYLTICLGFTLVNILSAQKRNSSYIFGNSLVHHEFQVNQTPSQETSVPHWLHFLSETAGHTYEISGQYGFLPQHADLPPISNWSFDFAENAWDSDNENFQDVDFTNIIITPANFIQWQAPDSNYPMEQISPISASQDIIGWCLDQKESMVIHIYEGWPDMAPYLSNGFPPNGDEWLTYDQYMNGEFHSWFLEYLEILQASTNSTCLKIIPVGSTISALLKEEPLNGIQIADLYEDDAPHGTSTLYFLASLVTYMASYEEIAPLNFQIDPIIHPLVSENYQSIVEFIWDELNNMNGNDGQSQVFCNTISSNKNESFLRNKEVEIIPNPIHQEFKVLSKLDIYSLEFFNVYGQLQYTSSTHGKEYFDSNELKKGAYIMRGKNEDGEILFLKKIFKL